MRVLGCVVGALVLLVAAVGCVSRSGDEPATARPPPPPPTAADGDDIAACADGDCEILLADEREILTPAGTLALALADGRLDYEIVSPDGGSNSGSAEGLCVCTITVDGTGGGSTCFVEGDPPDLDPAPGELALQVVGADTDSPVLRMPSAS